ncbi:zinc finger domain-containing protein [Bodo saltans virus]|uniref:Zinc finger domain-containing protein n=1 Tax=Bodo saltans virus TaxID=2024608 RepID=A0A2H4UVA7_9VIRU|nr:zinc finger domain-containing protein [Bodo saltans virus]ATZ80858.1 zinc finger domain-containing protein [Bodo saltans virus]
MSVSNIVDRDMKHMKNSKKELMDCIMVPSNKNWTKSQLSYPNVDVFMKNGNENGCCCICGISVINANAETLLNEIRDTKNWKKMDNMVEKTEFIDINETSRMIHFIYSGITGIISKRDIVFMENIVRDNDGTMMIVLSPTDLDMYKKQNDCVRAELRSGGWIFKQISDNQCYVVYHLNIDFKFNMVNQQIMNLFASKIPTVISKLSAIVNKQN